MVPSNNSDILAHHHVGQGAASGRVPHAPGQLVMVVLECESTGNPLRCRCRASGIDFKGSWRVWQLPGSIWLLAKLGWWPPGIVVCLCSGFILQEILGRRLMCSRHG